MEGNVLYVKNIKKSFGGVQALKGVDLSIKKGEIHCLAGENGCGKSTIIKIISGFYQPDEGSIEINGKIYQNLSTADAIEAGIQVIYQDFSVFPNLTVMENLALNQIISEKRKWINKNQIRKIAEEAIKKINYKIDLDARVESLPVADKQLIAICRALLHNAKLIIMDEPTTALTRKEVQRLLDIIMDLKKEGIAVLFVSHKLDEVLEVADSITILRSGENVHNCAIHEMTKEKFVHYMTGRVFDIDAKRETQNFKDKKIVLKVENLKAEGLKEINFELHDGEILGIVGQLGSGRTELSLALFGMMKGVEGNIFINGKKVKLNSAADAQRNGIALVPEDRLTEGLFLTQAIYKNISASNMDKMVKAGVILSENEEKKLSQDWIDEIRIAAKDHTLPVATLSGGNQQKVVLARCLTTNPQILILNGPTVGVDIGAKYDIHELLKKLTQKGMSILIVSDDAAEVTSLCDRAIIMNDGQMTGELDNENLSEKNIYQLIV